MSTGSFPMITNYLSPTSFTVVIDRMPNVEFFAQRCMIPALTMNPVQSTSPIQNYYLTPDRVTYSDFDLGFIVDENMRNYLEIHDWMVGIGAPENTDQYKTINKSEDGTTSDISIVINNSNKNPNKKITFTNCFPISMSSVSLSVTNPDIVYPEVTATFRYDLFKVEDYN